MNEGVKILLERIKTHPEEFIKGGRWVSMLAEYREYIPDEIEPIAVEMRKLIKEEFTKEVMKELLHADDKDEYIEDLFGKRKKEITDELHRKWVATQTTYGRLKYDAIEEG